jgi:hypothetical protein
MNMAVMLFEHPYLGPSGYQEVHIISYRDCASSSTGSDLDLDI